GPGRRRRRRARRRAGPAAIAVAGARLPPDRLRDRRAGDGRSPAAAEAGRGVMLARRAAASVGCVAALVMAVAPLGCGAALLLAAAPAGADQPPAFTAGPVITGPAAV